jgi:hypothetical protein
MITLHFIDLPMYFDFRFYSREVNVSFRCSLSTFDSDSIHGRLQEHHPRKFMIHRQKMAVQKSVDGVFKRADTHRSTHLGIRYPTPQTIDWHPKIDF